MDVNIPQVKIPSTLRKDMYFSTPTLFIILFISTCCYSLPTVQPDSSIYVEESSKQALPSIIQSYTTCYPNDSDCVNVCVTQISVI